MTVAASPPASETRRGLPRWVWVLLIASLAANLFVVGVVARAVWPSRYANAGHGPGGFFGNLTAYSKSLPEDRRKAVRQGIAAEHPIQALRPLRDELRAARQEAARQFQADPFNREAFLAAEARVQAAESKIRQAVMQFAVDLAGRMTADERAGFLKWRELRRASSGRGGAQAGRDAEPGNATPKPSE